MAKRKRRAFTTEFKAEAVRLVRESGKSVPTVARELDLTETALRSWVRQAEIDAGRGRAGERSRPRSARSWGSCVARSGRCGWSATS